MTSPRPEDWTFRVEGGDCGPVAIWFICGDRCERMTLEVVKAAGRAGTDFLVPHAVVLRALERLRDALAVRGPRDVGIA